MYLNNGRGFQVQVLYLIGLYTRNGSVEAEIDFSFINENNQVERRSQLVEFGDLLSGRINEFLNAGLKKELKKQEALTEISEKESDMNWEGSPN
jgi:hypothetical protein